MYISVNPAPNAKKIQGLPFGSLIAVRPVKHEGNNKLLWECLCVCKSTCYAQATALLRGDITSCGCKKKERGRLRLMTHGKSHLPEYRLWQSMKSRCVNRRAEIREHYLDRGIRVCDRWQYDFRAFLADMGLRPEPHLQLDRKNNNLGYACGKCEDCHTRQIFECNVRWATPTENLLNREGTKLIHLRGKHRTLWEWCQISGVDFATVRSRIKRGMPIEEAVFIPPSKSGRRKNTQKTWAHW
jgi:hypothetical protein